MIELIPAIDVIESKCVRLVQGSYDRKRVYTDDPLEVAREFERMGICRLHLVDLDGAKAGHPVNSDILERICRETGLVVDFGGGIKTRDHLLSIFGSGASMVTAGSIAVRDPERVKDWIEEFGPDKIIIGADVRDGKISIDAWQEDTRLELTGFIEAFRSAGASRVICTDITKDGMLLGPSVDLYRELCTRFSGMDIIASGGVSGMRDIEELEDTGISGIIFGKAWYEGRISRKEIVDFLDKK